MRTTLLLLTALGAGAVSGSAHAMGGDAPVRLATGALEARLATLGPRVPAYVPHFGVTFAAGFVAVPVGLGLASLVGSLSNALVWAAVPSLLVMALVAPTLTTLAAWLYGNWHFLGDDAKPFGFWLPWAGAVALHVVSLIVAGFLGVSVAAPASVMMLALVESALTSGLVVGGMRLFRQDVAPVAIKSFSPGVTDTQFIALGRVAF